jgi:hypothetical protein
VTSRDAFGLTTEGLEETQKGLAGLDKSLKQPITKGLRKFTGELVTRATAIGSGLGGVHRHAVQGGGIQQAAKTDRGVIRLSSSSSPTILGAEFGAKAYPQFPRWKGNQFTIGGGSGYMLHPALREYLPKGERKLAKAIVEQIGIEIR